MVKKTYRTRQLKGLHLLLKDSKGKRLEIIFRGGIQVDSTAKFTTSDEEVQKAMEACSSFGRDFYIESAVEKNPEVESVPTPAPEKEEAPKQEPEKILTDMKDSRRFHNIVEMRNAMEELGIKVTPNMNYLKAKAAAAKAGYDFQIQKN